MREEIEKIHQFKKQLRSLDAQIAQHEEYRDTTDLSNPLYHIAQQTIDALTDQFNSIKYALKDHVKEIIRQYDVQFSYLHELILISNKGKDDIINQHCCELFTQLLEEREEFLSVAFTHYRVSDEPLKTPETIEETEANEETSIAVRA